MTWAVLGDSLPGTSHRTRNVPCQDAFRVRVFGPSADWLVLAVADGAGSSSFGDVGANIACEEIIRHVEERDANTISTRDGVVGLFAEVRATLAAEAGERGVGLRELACTSLLAVVGPETAAFAQLGDGAIVIGPGPNYRIVFWPEPAEYANATDFLTDNEFAEAIRFEIVPEPITELALLTDGLQRVALDYSTRTAFPGFFRPLFDCLRTEVRPGDLCEPFRQFLDSSRVNSRTDDDKTLVLAIRHTAHDAATAD